MMSKSEPPYPVGAIANYMLDRGEEDGVPITHLKLQKLVYIAYGWALAALNVELFSERIEAWRYGPVVPDLWHEFKSYRAGPIGDGRSFDYDWGRDRLIFHKVPLRAKGVRRLLRAVWKEYSSYTASRLVVRTHRDGAPWDTTIRKHGLHSRTRIDTDLIREHFELLQEDPRFSTFQDLRNTA